VPACYLSAVDTPYTEHRVGEGEKKIPLWLDDERVPGTKVLMF
jgi:hypothetical protein